MTTLSEIEAAAAALTMEQQQELLVYLAVHGGSATTEAAVAKLHISESWVKNCLDAIQVFGGRGYTTAYELERDLRDAVGGVLYAGTAEMQRALISQELGL